MVDNLKSKIKKEGAIGECRIAILNPEKCKPKKCGLECKKICPMNRDRTLENLCI